MFRSRSKTRTTETQEAEDRDRTLQWAWELHKEADNLLHQRLNGFVAVNAFLTAGYFFATQAVYDGRPAGTFMMGISLAGLVLAPLFVGVIRRLVNGIRYLKEEHLFHDAVYSAYFGNRKPGRFFYGLAYGVPLILFGLWLLAFVYAASLAFATPGTPHPTEIVSPRTPAPPATAPAPPPAAPPSPAPRPHAPAA